MRNGKVEQAGRVDELQRDPATPYVKRLFDQARAGRAALERPGA
jgi:ABC-type proline/glycine betaine transport system ATPase subunit